MPTLRLTDQQVIELVRQLAPERQAELLRLLLLSQGDAWSHLSGYGEERVRLVAHERGRDWDTMTEDEREAFIDDLLHEDRLCGG